MEGGGGGTPHKFFFFFFFFLLFVAFWWGRKGRMTVCCRRCMASSAIYLFSLSLSSLLFLSLSLHSICIFKAVTERIREREKVVLLLYSWPRSWVQSVSRLATVARRTSLSLPSLCRDLLTALIPALISPTKIQTLIVYVCVTV